MISWEEACRNSVSVEEVCTRHEKALLVGESLVGQQVKLRGFLVILEGQYARDKAGNVQDRVIFEATMIQQNEDDQVMRNLLTVGECYIPYLISVDQDDDLHTRLYNVMWENLYETHMFSAHAAVMTGTLVDSYDFSVQLGIVPLSTTIRRMHLENGETATF